MRLIDADALKIENVDLEHGCTVVDYAMAVIKSVVDAPTIDAVPVVRCKDCAYMEDAYVCNGFLICPASNMEIANNDFCSYGERKEAEGNDA